LNEKDEKNEKKAFEDIKVQQKDGINVEYDEEDLQKKFPHLMSEMSNKEQSIKIDSITREIEKVKNVASSKNEVKIPNELINPGTIDFLRRCTTTEEAFEIIEFLLQKNELTREEYDDLHGKIMQEGGLKKLIEECGGFKKKGYYSRKYYKKKV